MGKTMKRKRKTKDERRRSKTVRIPFEKGHVEVAQLVLERAGSPAAQSTEAAVTAVFTIGLGVLSGHYNEFLAGKLQAGVVGAFGPDGPARLCEALKQMHGEATMPEIARALLEEEPTPPDTMVESPVQ